MEKYSRINREFSSIYFSGVKLVGESTDTLKILDKDDGDGKVIVHTINNEVIELSDGDTTPRKTSFSMATGGAGDITVVFPNANSIGMLYNDGGGNLAWQEMHGVEDVTYTLDYNDGASKELLAADTDRLIEKVIINVLTAFDATGPTLDIGQTGDTDKYVDQLEIDLTSAGVYDITVAHQELTSKDVLATFGAGAGGTQGQAKVTVFASKPVQLT